jgi:hypothetical protein
MQTQKNLSIVEITHQLSMDGKKCFPGKEEKERRKNGLHNDTA